MLDVCSSQTTGKRASAMTLCFKIISGRVFWVYGPVIYSRCFLELLKYLSGNKYQHSSVGCLL